MSHFETESPENYEQKCCCALVLDISTSMQGEPIQELNKGIQSFHDEIQNDSILANRLEIAVITFSSEIETLIEPSLVTRFIMPDLSVKGSTKLVDGVREGIKVVKSRKEWYKKTGQPYNRPWVILITDGAPNHGQDVAGLTNEIRFGVEQKDFNFLSIGVKSADMKLLSSIADPSMTPLHIDGLRFTEFFKWLSASMSTISNSRDGEKINLPKPTWMTGFTV